MRRSWSTPAASLLLGRHQGPQKEINAVRSESKARETAGLTWSCQGNRVRTPSEAEVEEEEESS